MVTSAVAAFVSGENTYRGANGIPLFVPGQSVLDFSDIVAAGGNKTFASGYDAVVLDGPRANYTVQVSSTGLTTIKDIGAGDATYGQTITVSGESYLVFNGNNLASSTVTVAGAPTYPNDAYIVETGTQAQLTQFYAALLQRQPDFGGLEYWQNSLAHGSSMIDIANDFLTIIHSSYAGSSPITTLGGDPGTMSNTQYITALYQNLLGRGPDSAGLAYWVGAMDAGTLTQAAALVNFTDVSALLSAVNAEPGATPGSGTGWLINCGLTGGYADPGAQLAASTVLANGNASGYIDTNLIDTSSIQNTTVGAAFITVVNSGAYLEVGSTANNTTIVLSPAFSYGGESGTGATIISPTNGGVTIAFSNNHDTAILHGNGNTINFQTTNYAGSLSGEAIIGWNSTDKIALQSAGVWTSLAANGSPRATPADTASILTPTTTPVLGTSLNFFPDGTNNPGLTFVVNLGSVGGGSAAEVAAKANTLYAASGAVGENIIFMGTTNTGDTVLDFWGTWNRLTGNTGDTNGNHLVDASEFSASVTLIGVNANSLTIDNFHK